MDTPTIYTGDGTCVGDYMNLIGNRVEWSFAQAFDSLDRTCTNSRGAPTGN